MNDVLIIGAKTVIGRYTTYKKREGGRDRLFGE